MQISTVRRTFHSLQEANSVVPDAETLEITGSIVALGWHNIDLSGFQ